MTAISGAMANGSLATAFGAGMNIASGFGESRSYNTEAGMMKSQANEAIRQAQAEAESKAFEVRQYAGNQQEEYSSSGVTMAGTPADVVADTRKRGQQEVNAITRRGAFQAQLYRTQANQLKSAGRNAILGGLFKAGTSILSSSTGTNFSSKSMQPLSSYQGGQFGGYEPPITGF